MKTKIIATVGPACSSKEILKQLILEGVNVFRLNFSHSSHEDHLQVIGNIRELNRELKTHAAILADLQGPKIRIGMMENGPVQLMDGDEVTFTTRETPCNRNLLNITYPEFARDVKPGENIQLDDGKLLLSVTETDSKDTVKTRVVHGGVLSSRKGVNLPNTAISLPSLTEKDRKDLEFAVSQKVNWIALSFVRSAEDLKILRKTINELSDQGFKPKIIAKIEKPEALVNIDAIIQETDGVMVARGDLGVELPLEQVPLVQKTLVNKCVKASKPVIIATQMMEGMITNIRPTRAEVNDVANSVLDGADALMLSGETSVGEFPVEVIKTMKKIILEVENFQDIYDKPHSPDLSDKERIISDSILFAACNIANEANARAIIAMTHTGYSAFRISSRRPRQDIYIFSTSHELLCMLNLVWGVKGVYLSEVIQSTSRTLKMIADKLLSDGSVAHGDLLVNVTSTPVYVSGKTNMVKLSFA